MTYKLKLRGDGSIPLRRSDITGYLELSKAATVAEKTLQAHPSIHTVSISHGLQDVALFKRGPNGVVKTLLR